MWSYNPSSGLPRDALRLLIGDTISSEQQLQDEELDVFVAGRGTIFGAAADACRALAAKFSRSVTQSGGGGAKANFSDLSIAYGRMALTFDAKAIGLAAAPYAGGISISDKIAEAADGDRVPPRFRYGMMDDFSVPAGGSPADSIE